MDEYITRTEHKEFADRIDAENKRQNARLEKLEDTVEKIGELTASVKVLAMNMDNMAKEQAKQNESLNEQAKKIDDLKMKPANNWDKFVWAVGGAIIAAVVAFVLNRIGL